MSELAPLGRGLILFGLILILIGALMAFVGKVPRLPGDVLIRRDGTVIYIPIVSSIVLSILLTVILSLLFTRR